MTSAKCIISGQVGDRQGLPDRRKWRFNDLLETSGIARYGKKALARKVCMCVCECVWWGVEGSVDDEPDWKLFMGQRGQAHPRRAPARILKFSVMSFCSPLMAAQLRQWEAKRVEGEKRVEWFILPPCRSLWVIPLEIVSNVTVLRRKISTLCLSVTAAQTYSAHAHSCQHSVFASSHFKADIKYPPDTWQKSMVILKCDVYVMTFDIYH